MKRTLCVDRELVAPLVRLRRCTTLLNHWLATVWSICVDHWRQWKKLPFWRGAWSVSLSAECVHFRELQRLAAFSFSFFRSFCSLTWYFFLLQSSSTISSSSSTTQTSHCPTGWLAVGHTHLGHHHYLPAKTHTHTDESITSYKLVCLLLPIAHQLLLSAFTYCHLSVFWIVVFPWFSTFGAFVTATLSIFSFVLRQTEHVHYRHHHHQPLTLACAFIDVNSYLPFTIFLFFLPWAHFNMRWSAWKLNHFVL